MSNLVELKGDSKELSELLEVAKRPRVKDVLQSELSSVAAKIGEIETKKAKEEEKLATAEVAMSGSGGGEPVDDKPKSTTKPQPKVQRSKITSFGIDQTATNYNIYITLEGVGSLDKDQIQVEFGQRSLSLTVCNLNNKTYEFVVPKLAGEVEPKKCKYKVKPDKITLFLKKAKQGEWKGLSEVEAKGKEATEKEKRSAVPEINKDKDPQESLMDMMKNMYDEGDDEMKRTIAKAWTESREKQASGNMDM